MIVSDFRLLAYYVEIVRAGSIRGAANKLSLSPAVVSTALSDLEKILGVTLLRRTTRNMDVTEAGKEFFARAVKVLDAFNDAMSFAGEREAKISGPVALTVPVELALHWLPPLLAEFQNRNRDVDIDLHADDAEINLQRSRYDIALRATISREISDDAIANIPLELVCAPALNPGGFGSLKQALANLSLIGTGSKQLSGTLSAIHRKTGRISHIPVTAGVRVNNHAAAQQLAKQGLGAALLMTSALQEDLAHGTLVPISRAHSFGFVQVRMIYRDRLPSPAALALGRFLSNA